MGLRAPPGGSRGLNAISNGFTALSSGFSGNFRWFGLGWHMPGKEIVKGPCWNIPGGLLEVYTPVPTKILGG